MSKTLGYLPNICGPQPLLRIVAAALFLANILALAGADDVNEFLVKLGLNALFILWVTLASALVLCLVNRFYTPPSNKIATLIITAVVMVFTLLASVK